MPNFQRPRKPKPKSDNEKNGLSFTLTFSQQFLQQMIQILLVFVFLWCLIQLNASVSQSRNSNPICNLSQPN